MAVHEFVCDKCNVTVTDTSTKGIHKCPKCKGDMRWSLGDITVNDNNNERWSVSMGCPASQVEVFRKRYPKSVYNDKGDLLIKNRKHKLQEMKERGMCEIDNKINRKKL